MADARAHAGASAMTAAHYDRFGIACHGGNAGNVALTISDQLTLIDGSSVSSSTQSVIGRAGEIDIDAEPPLAYHLVDVDRYRRRLFDVGALIEAPSFYPFLSGRQNLIELAATARRVSPSAYVMWYWGLRSPFWALHGDSIKDVAFEVAERR